MSTPVAATPVPVDLSTWTAHNQPYTGPGTADPGIWTVDGSGQSVAQSINGRPTFFASPVPAEDNRITVSFETPLTDDDFFGLALGFSTSPTDPSTDYLLIDWRQSFQDINWGEGTGPVTGTPGLAVSRVTGVPTLNEFWGHIDSAASPAGGVVELARGTTLGNVGWTDATVYAFVVEYTTTSLDVWVDGSHELSIAGDFPAGPLALYDFSLADLGMSGITTEPLNDPPVVTNGGADDVVANEGTSGATSGAFTDPDGDPLTLTCTGQCGGFVDNGDGSWSWAQNLAEGPMGFSVTIEASDGLLEVSDEFSVTVLNLAPVIQSVSALADNHDMGSPLVVSFDFTDAGVLDTHTATFQWGDGTNGSGVVVESAGAGSASASHVYVDPGFYTVSVTVTDDDGASDTASLGEVFVFDPDSFVTGGGWISSPSGAVVSNPGHTGRATFGFVVRYDKSGAVRGSLQFQSHKGINLHATGFDYLLIDDGIAEFDGWGTVNGIPGHYFRVVATDERHSSSSEDLFWITISGPGGLIFDGAVFPAGGVAVVGKGIQIHSKH
jgi:hypothetical protein